MEDPEKSLKQLICVEEAAEDILRDKSEIIALDKRRNANREGLRSLSRLGSDKAWVALGPVLVKLPICKAKSLIDDDQRVTDVQINKVRSDIKVKFNKLRDLEYEDKVPGLDLQPLSTDELTAIKNVIGMKY